MTQRAMEIFGKETSDFVVTGGTPFHSPRHADGRRRLEQRRVLPFAAKALGSSVEVTNLPGFPRVTGRSLICFPRWKIAPSFPPLIFPDLVPILAVTAACKNGAVFTDIRRLRLKESDRVASVIAMVEALGGKAQASEDTLTVYGTGLVGGTVDTMNDHRIAMSAAIAATACNPTRDHSWHGCVEKVLSKILLKNTPV